MSNNFLNLASNLRNTNIFYDKWVPLSASWYGKAEVQEQRWTWARRTPTKLAAHHNYDHSSPLNTRWLSPHMSRFPGRENPWLPLLFDSGEGGCSANTSRAGESWCSKSLSKASMRLVMSESSELCRVLPGCSGWAGGVRGAGDSLSGCGSWCWGTGGGGAEWCSSGLWAWCWLPCWLCFAPLDFLPAVWPWAMACESKTRALALLADWALVLLEVLALLLALTFSTSAEFLLPWLLCGWTGGPHCLWLPALGRDAEPPVPQNPLLWLGSQLSVFKLKKGPTADQ